MSFYKNTKYVDGIELKQVGFRVYIGKLFYNYITNYRSSTSKDNVRLDKVIN